MGENDSLPADYEPGGRSWMLSQPYFQRPLDFAFCRYGFVAQILRVQRVGRKPLHTSLSS